jgi:hypothetical protein
MRTRAQSAARSGTAVAVSLGVAGALFLLWRPDDASDGVWLRWLLIFLAGYVALFHLIVLAGAGVGWIMDASAGERAPAPQAGDGPLVFRVRRWRQGLMTLGSLALVAAYLWIYGHLHPVMGALGVAAFTPWILVHGMAFAFPSRLALYPDRFEAKHWSGPLETAAWRDLEPLFTFGGPSYAYVCYRFRQGRLPARLSWAQRYRRRIGQCDGTIPDDLPIATEDLCRLMNGMRERAGR